MPNTLEIPEILEAIFAFLGRKDLYRSCTRVDRQWNAVSMRVIQKKRKAEFIKIPGIRDRVLNNLWHMCADVDEFRYYCGANILWKIDFEHQCKTFKYYDIIKRYDTLCCLRGSTWNWVVGRRSMRKYLHRNMLALKREMRSCPKALMNDSFISDYYHETLDEYKFQIEFHRLARSCRSYNYKPNTEDEFRKLVRVFRSIRH
jgi:hypothetical protein